MWKSCGMDRGSGGAFEVEGEFEGEPSDQERKRETEEACRRLERTPTAYPPEQSDPRPTFGVRSQLNCLWSMKRMGLMGLP
jgi:hypothetical protein